VALYAANSLEWIVAYLGVLRAGACAVMINPSYGLQEAAHIVRNADPIAIIADRPRTAIAESLGTRVWTVDELDQADWPELPPLGPDSVALIVYTSGTTGRTKGALLDHGNVLAQVRGVVEMWEWSPSDVLVHALPLFHLHGLGIGLHGTLESGGSATLISFSPEAVVAELTRTDRHRGTMFFGVPAMYLRLCEWLEEHEVDLSHVRLWVSGSAPLSPALFERCARLLGQPPLERYGATECGVVVSTLYDVDRRMPGYVGYPLPGVEVRLGHNDELLVRGGQVASGYWRNPQATSDAFTSDGFFRTGDVATVDDDGAIAIRGRLKELIITGGFNVYPREVERVLETLASIREVAVAGVPSERWGEEVTAFVVPAGTQPLDEQEIVASVREHLAAYKCPKRVIAVDVLPRNAMGKVDRSALVASLNAGAPAAQVRKQVRREPRVERAESP
jgi:malonyl-CoA/methylmalonyl-CoA synthetase